MFNVVHLEGLKFITYFIKILAFPAFIGICRLFIHLSGLGAELVDGW